MRKIAPYTYQVKKSECLDLPPKTYGTAYYSLTRMQEQHYDDIANQLLFEVDELEPYTIYRLFTGLQNVISGMQITVGEKLQSEPFFKSSKDNPRIQKLLEILEGTEEKVIIFCKYTHEILSITNILNELYGEGAAVAFYGDVRQKERQENIRRFEKDAQFFVANKTCAGYGLNLQFCSYVIYYNNDWDWATRGQSEDRVHRIGQTENVHYIDICAIGTLDERILKCLERKENLVESFKAEIEGQKDKNHLEAWINFKNKFGTKIVKKSEIKKYEDLMEDDSNGKDIQ